MDTLTPEARSPFPSFTLATARAKVQAAEDGCNTRDPEKVALAYTPDSVWRNREVHLVGHPAIVEFLTRKWEREQDYALRKDLWGFGENRIAVRFQYEWRDDRDRWWRSYGNELWQFARHGLMSRHEASIDDRRIALDERRILGPRSGSERGLDVPVW